MDSVEAPGIVDALARIEAITEMLRPPESESTQATGADQAALGTGSGAAEFAGQLAAASSGAPTTTSPAAKTSFELTGAGTGALPSYAPSAYGTAGYGGAGYGVGAYGGGYASGVYGPAAVGAYGSVPAGAYAAPSAATAPASSVTGAQLDAWMREKVPDSPLVGLGDVFVREGLSRGIDPRFLVSVALNESSLGTAGSGAGIHNAFGWGPAIPFDSWEQNIATVAQGLVDGYVSKGLDSVAEIQGKWAPVGASNDPGNLNSNWLRGVSSSLRELGGDPERVSLDPAQATSAAVAPWPWSVASPGTLST